LAIKPIMAMKKQQHLCVDVTTYTENEMKTYDEANGKIWKDENDHFTFIETKPVVHKTRPDLQWHELDESQHGKLKLNRRHIHVELNIPVSECANGHHAADILARQSEQFEDTLDQLNLAEELVKCAQ